jgi:hypothetical protein
MEHGNTVVDLTSLATVSFQKSVRSNNMACGTVGYVSLWQPSALKLEAEDYTDTSC